MMTVSNVYYFHYNILGRNITIATRIIEIYNINDLFPASILLYFLLLFRLIVYYPTEFFLNMAFLGGGGL